MIEIVKELTNLRTANKKVYLLSDGTHKAVFYPNPVHYFNEQTGMYEEITESTPMLTSDEESSIFEIVGIYGDDFTLTNTNNIFVKLRAPMGSSSMQLVKSLSLELSQIECSENVDGAVVTLHSVSDDNETSDKMLSFAKVSKEQDTTYSLNILPEIEIISDIPKTFAICMENMPDGEYIKLSNIGIISMVYQPVESVIDTSRAQSFELGRDSFAYVDRQFGNLMLDLNCVKWQGNRMPFEFGLMYNSLLSENWFSPSGTFNEIADFHTNTGLGVKPSILCSMFPFDDNKIHYVDKSGAVTEFIATEDSDKFVSKNDEDAIYTKSTRTLKTSFETYVFDEDGKVVSVSDENGNTQVYTYDEKARLISVTDGQGRVFTFEYQGESDYLLAINCPDNTKTELGYADNCLAFIKYSDGSKLSFTYENAKCKSVKLLSATNEIMRDMNFMYINDKIIRVTSSVASEQLYTLDFAYSSASKCTTVTKQTESETLKTVYVFDTESDVQNEYTMYKDGDSFVPFNTPSYNLISDYTFENGSWIPYHTDESEVSFPENESLAYIGKTFARINPASTDGGKGICTITHSFDEGDYTYSCYVRVVKGFETGGVSLRVTDLSGNILAQSESINASSDVYTRLSLPFSLSTQTALRFLVVAGGGGLAYADCPCVTKGEGLSEYNYIDTSIFEDELCLSSNLMQGSFALQQIPVKSEKSTRESFTLSGFAKSETAVSEGTFCLKAELLYADGETEEFTSDFMSFVDEWQKTELSFSKSKYKELTTVSVSCVYENNVGSALFKDISLVRDSIETDLEYSDFETESYIEPSFTETEDIPTNDFEEAKNDKGEDLTETSFSKDAFGTIYKAYEYDDNGNIIKETDSRGNDTLYTVDAVTSKPSLITAPDMSTTAFSYDSLGRTSAVQTDGATVGYQYDALDNITEISRGDSQKYMLSYTNYGELKSIAVAGKDEKLVEYEYKSGSGNLKSVTYANGHTMNATYNAKGQLIAEKWYSDSDATNLVAHYKYVYDDNGNVARSIDLTNKKEYNYSYTDGNLSSAFEYSITVTDEIITARTLLCSIVYSYDKDGNLKSKKTTLANGSESVTEYSENEITTTVADKKYISRSKSDGLSRKLYDEIVLPTAALYRKFDYCEGVIPQIHKDTGKVVGTPTTNLVSKITFTDEKALEYEYDSQERITKVVELENDTVVNETVYTYDAKGQLLTETVNNTTVNTMTYDSYGNITSKNGVTYTYGNTVWKDLLTKVGEQEIVYDAQGNPTSYLGHELTWEKGRQLKEYKKLSVDNDANSISFKYNANGIRTAKTVGSTTHTYTVDGTKILREFFGGRTIIPMYDNEDEVCGIVYNGNAYYFVKNLQGDVIYITNEAGETVAKYSYDAWGKPTTVFDTSGKNVAYYNPFRYRCYYYDVETGLYYLQSRYYDPEVGRFICADSPEFATIGQTAIQTNLFAYCGNDPANNVDYLGYFTVSRDRMAFLIDVTLSLVSYWAKYSYDLIGLGLKTIFKRSGKKFLLDTLSGTVPKIKSWAGKFLTILRTVLWRIGYIALSKVLDKIIGSVKYFFSQIQKFIKKGDIDIIFCLFSTGGFLALFLDMFSDGVLNEKIQFFK